MATALVGLLPMTRLLVYNRKYLEMDQQFRSRRGLLLYVAANLDLSDMEYAALGTQGRTSHGPLTLQIVETPAEPPRSVRQSIAKLLFGGGRTA